MLLKCLTYKTRTYLLSSYCNGITVLAKNNAKEIEEEVIAECYDDIDDTNENSGSDSQESDEENDRPDPKVLDKFKVNYIYK